LAESTTERIWPQKLAPVTGPFPEAKIVGTSLGMGAHGPATVDLIDSGLLSPDLMTGLTLYLLARQPRTPREEGKPSKGAPGVAGRIWVREQVTYHRPLGTRDAFVIEGAGTGRYVRKGRRYGTTESVTRDSEGKLASTNRTTGLLAYRVDESLVDAVEGQPLEDMSLPSADWKAAENNPHLAALSGVRVGTMLGGIPVVVSLDMMRARDTDNPDNPIHSDPEIALAAGLAKPIAGGSHVQAFALELLMAAWGPEILLHGALVDCRWRVPTEADVAITPRAEIVVVEPDRVEVDLDVAIGDGPVAMVGHVTIPRPA
jgi:acyl dehydratase